MNTNTYRCGCGRILGYLPSGAKETCTTCLQVRRQEAIAKAGAREGTYGRHFGKPRAPASDMLDAFRYAAEAQQKTMEAWMKAWPEASRG